MCTFRLIPLIHAAILDDISSSFNVFEPTFLNFSRTPQPNSCDPVILCTLEIWVGAPGPRARRRRSSPRWKRVPCGLNLSTLNSSMNIHILRRHIEILKNERVKAKNCVQIRHERALFTPNRRASRHVKRNQICSTWCSNSVRNGPPRVPQLAHTLPDSKFVFSATFSPRIDARDT